MNIVISSVSLMRHLKFRKKLSEADIEKAEDLIKDIHMENTRQKYIKRGGSSSVSVDRTATKNADKVSTQVESQSLTQSNINTQMENSISPHKYVCYDLALHAYSEQFYTGYDIFPPTFNTWVGYTPQRHFNMYMGNAPVQNYFHEMAYPSQNSDGPWQETNYDSHLSQQQGNNISVLVSQCKDDFETTTSTNNEPCAISGKDDCLRTFHARTSEQSTDAYSDKAGYTTSDCEADTESLAQEADHLLTCTWTTLVKENASSSDLPWDSIDGTVTVNKTISSTETVPETKNRKYEVNTTTYQLQ